MLLDDRREETVRARRGLALMTLLGTMDGTILMLAATSRLDSLHDAVLVGLTVLGGAGAWTLAQQSFAGKRGAKDYAWLAGLAAVSALAAAGSAWAGATMAQSMTLHILPKAAGIVLLLIALEVGGLRLPTLAKVPMPMLVLLVGVALEALPWMS